MASNDRRLTVVPSFGENFKSQKELAEMMRGLDLELELVPKLSVNRVVVPKEGRKKEKTGPTMQKHHKAA